MDTGGKIATGILVPVGIGIAAVVGYMLYYRPKKTFDMLKLPMIASDPVLTDPDVSDEQKKKHAEVTYGVRINFITEKRPRIASDLPHEPAYSNGGVKRRRKTHRRRR